MAHASWFTYAGMTRIYKHYHTALHLPGIRTQSASFSSYAGEPLPPHFPWGRGFRIRSEGLGRSVQTPRPTQARLFATLCRIASGAGFRRMP